MKTEYWLFIGGALFFLPLGIIYGALTNWEAVGTVAILLTGGLGALVGSYLWVTAHRIDARPEDDLYAEIADGAGEQGVFAPQSWWPFALGFCVMLFFIGIALGFWITLIGGVVSVLCLIGLVFEFYRGAHAH